MFPSSAYATVPGSSILIWKAFSALPWGYRIAAVLREVRVASDPKGFGRLVYGVFLMLGVQGLPPTTVMPQTTREIDKLPKGYGHEFGITSRRVAQKFFSSEDQVDELISLVSLKVLSDASLHRAIRGKTLPEAKSYIFKVISNQARDLLRSQKVRRHDELTDVIGDPTSWRSLRDLIPEAELETIQDELEESVSSRLLPDLPLYFDLLMDGRSNKEIAEKRLLPSLVEKPMSQQALAKYRDRIKTVLERHFDVRGSLLRTEAG